MSGPFFSICITKRNNSLVKVRKWIQRSDGIRIQSWPVYTLIYIPKNFKLFRTAHMVRVILGLNPTHHVNMRKAREKMKMLSVNQMSIYHTVMLINCSKILQMPQNCLPTSKVWDFDEKRLHCVSVVRAYYSGSSSVCITQHLYFSDYLLGRLECLILALRNHSVR